MSSTKTITVVGVTGNQGRAIAKTFLASGWHVRGLTRSTTTAAAERLLAAGVELVQADIDDKSSLVMAFRGSEAIYANTDFFALMKYPHLNTLLSTTYAGKALNEACMEHEFNQGRNIIDAAAQVLSERSPLDYFVLSTLSSASKWSRGDITHLLHFDSKWKIESYLREQHLALAAKTRYLQVGFYMPNVVEPFLLPKRAEDGVYEFQWANINLSTLLTATSPERDVGIFVRSLISETPGTVLLGESDPLTVEQFIQTWSAVTGLPARLNSIGTDELEAIVEPVMPSFGKEFAENFQYYRDFTYTGGDPNVKKPSDLGIDKIELTTFKDYLSSCDRVSLLKT